MAPRDLRYSSKASLDGLSGSLDPFGSPGLRLYGSTVLTAFTDSRTLWRLAQTAITMMMIFYCSYRNKILHAAIYMFGLGIRHYGQELKHM